MLTDEQNKLIHVVYDTLDFPEPDLKRIRILASREFTEQQIDDGLSALMLLGFVNKNEKGYYWVTDSGIDAMAEWNLAFHPLYEEMRNKK